MAQQALLDMDYWEGTIADWLARLGYGPENSVIDSRDRLKEDGTK